MKSVESGSGVLSTIDVEHRFAAIAIGLGVFYATSRSTQIATFATVTALALLEVGLG